ncbi:helix-turn-helix domain-containing protein [Thalassobacillus sp. C254]|nr:helix-turn-helix domain-containing protein [Thalassobacillus sp. C254]
MEQEREVIINVLKETKGNKSQAAKKLGIHRSTLYEKLKKLQIK